MDATVSQPSQERMCQMKTFVTTVCFATALCLATVAQAGVRWGFGFRVAIPIGGFACAAPAPAFIYTPTTVVYAQPAQVVYSQPAQVVYSQPVPAVYAQPAPAVYAAPAPAVVYAPAPTVVYGTCYPAYPYYYGGWGVNFRFGFGGYRGWGYRGWHGGWHR
jgi:hypothetical protein